MDYNGFIFWALLLYKQPVPSKSSYKVYSSKKLDYLTYILVNESLNLRKWGEPMDLFLLRELLQSCQFVVLAFSMKHYCFYDWFDPSLVDYKGIGHPEK